MSELKYKETTEKIIGAAMRVHAALGNGFQEVDRLNLDLEGLIGLEGNSRNLDLEGLFGLYGNNVNVDFLQNL